MTITSDLVMGVARAADPAKHEAAVERLRRLGSDPVGDVAAFNPAKSTVQPPFSAQPPTAQSASATPRTLTAKSAPDAFRKLEAFVLQTFVQAMLPKNATNTFGKGAAGDVWKSMLAEKLGAQLAGSDQIGLANRLAAAAKFSDRVASAGPGNPSALVQPSAVSGHTLSGMAAAVLPLKLAGK